MFDEFSDYRRKSIVGKHHLFFFDSDSYTEECLDNIIINCMKYSISGYAKVSNKEPNFESLKPYFDWLPTGIIKKTF